VSSGLEDTTPAEEEAYGSTAVSTTDPGGKPGYEPTLSPDPSRGPTGATSPFQPLAKQFVRKSVLGRGGMGQVILAEDQRLGRPVALKELLSQSPAARARFEREVRLAARLQHPNIVPVYEAGTSPRGEPYYAMRPVDGKTLAAVIEQVDGPAARLALVPRMIAVARALAFAHAEGVIHRDLKPNNILVGDHGETLVIDWGLAKQLDDEATEPDGGREAHAAAATDASPHLTRHGSIIGTPSYMAPEQARGERLDARADVYAIGAILYHVLAGEAPYHGVTTADELLGRVRTGPPKPLAKLAPHAAPDLVAIVERAMHRDRSERYLDARGLADDLERFTTGRLVSAHAYTLGQLVGRWLRRHKVAVAVGTLAAVALATVGVYAFVSIGRERTVAVRERAAAVAGKQDVEALVDFMLGDLSSRLEKSGDLSALAGSVERVSDYLRRHPPAAGDRAGIRRRVALGVQLGAVASDSGDLPGAERELRAALALGEPLGTSGDPELADALHHARADLASVLLEQSKAADALTTLQHALDDAVALAERGDLEWRRRVGGDLFERSRIRSAMADPVAARRDAEAALATYRAVSAAVPENLVAQRDVGKALSRLALLAAEARDDQRALSLQTEAVAVSERLAEREPDQLLPRHDLLLSLQRLSRFQAATGDRARARETAERTRALAERLLIDDPARPSHAASLAGSLTELAGLARAEKDYARALPLNRRATELVAHLVEIDPTNTKWRKNLAETHDQLAATLRESGDRKAAIAAYDTPLAIRRKLVAEFPDAVEHVMDLALDLDMRAKLEVAIGDLAAGAADSLDAAQLREQVVAKRPDNREACLLAGISYMRAGTARADAGDKPGAVAAYASGKAIVDGFLARSGAPDKELSELAQLLVDLRADCCADVK
jgi:tetratricopeptide (TPR) repeat protein